MADELIINNFSELSRVVGEASKRLAKPRSLWWRGHGGFGWKILPSVFRDPTFARDERVLTLTFKDKAEPRITNPPSDKYRWLFMMQHFGLPTRLLDWTESPAIALWFAAEMMDQNGDGVLVGLNPYQLNVSQGFRDAILSLVREPVDPLFQRAYELRKNEETQKWVDDEAAQPHRVLAIRSPHSNLRMMVQRARFTIHSKFADLQTMPQHEDFLIKIRIPGGDTVKKSFLDDLKLAGITEDIIYPDLEHLAKVLKRNSKEEFL